MPTLESVADAIRELSLVAPEHLAQRIHRTAGSSPETLLDILVQENLLTLFQAEHLLHGTHHKLILGGYQLIEPLGEGGMGKVYKAFQIRLRRKVALKVIGSHMADDAQALRRFQREALAAAALNHPNIVTIYDFDNDGSEYFIAMEFVDGIDLAKLVKTQGKVGIREACIYIRQAAEGLQHAHDAGLIHRDIKPHNLLLTYPSDGTKSRSVVNPAPTSSLSAKLRTPGSGPNYAGRDPESAIVKILDMGLARFHDSDVEISQAALTQSQALLGTPDFIAPEQARDPRNVDGRADIYSLGCTLYYLLGARVPFPDRTGVEKLIAHQSEPPEPIESLRPQTPPSVIEIVQKMMAKRPDKRYRTPIEVARALDEVLRGSSSPVSSINYEPPLSPGYVEPQTPHTPAPPTLMTQPPRVAPPAWAVSAEQPTDSFRTLETSVELPSMTATPPQVGPASIDTSAASIVSEPEIFHPDLLGEWVAQRGHVSAMSFSSDGIQLATCGIDSVAHVWELTTAPPNERANGFSQRLATTSQLVSAPKFSQVAISSLEPNGQILIWNWGQTEGNNLTVMNSEPAAVSGLDYSPDGTLLAAGVGLNVWVFRVRAGEVKLRTTFKGHRHPIKTVAISSHDNLIASGSEDGTIRVWSVGRLWAGEKAALADHAGAIQALAWSPDGQRLASISEDQFVRVWNVAGNPTAGSSIIGKMDGVPRRLSWTQDGRGVFCINAGGHVILWGSTANSKRPRPLREWQLECGLLISVSMLSDGLLAIGTSEGLVRVFQLQFPW